MGWTTACLVINQGPYGYLGQFPRPSTNKGRGILTEDLGVKYSQSKLANFDRALSPPPGWFGFGVYDEALICSGHDELYGWVEKPHGHLVTSLISRYQKAEALVFELASVTGYFAFAYYANGQLQRSMAGDPDRGLTIDKHSSGPKLETLPASLIDSEEIAIKGEGVVFEMTRRFFGLPLNEFASEKLIIELIKKPGFLGRLLTRSRST